MVPPQAGYAAPPFNANQAPTEDPRETLTNWVPQEEVKEVARTGDITMKHSEISALLEYGGGNIGALVRELRRRRALSEEADAGPLSAAEKKLYAEGGLGEEKVNDEAPSAFDLAFADLFEMNRTSYALADAASVLGCSLDTLEGMIAQRRIYAYSLDGQRVVPKFQFIQGKLLPGLEQVLTVIDPRMPPLAVQAFFETPQAALRAATPISSGLDDSDLTPKQWLALGFSPAEVAALAHYLYAL